MFQTDTKTMRSKKFLQYTEQQALVSAFYDTLPERDPSGVDRDSLLRGVSASVKEKVAGPAAVWGEDPLNPDNDKDGKAARAENLKTLAVSAFLGVPAFSGGVAMVAAGAMNFGQVAAVSATIAAMTYPALNLLGSLGARNYRMAGELHKAINEKGAYKAMAENVPAMNRFMGYAIGDEEMIRQMPGDAVARLLRDSSSDVAAAMAIDKAHAYALDYGYGEEFVAGMKQVDEVNGTSWSDHLATSHTAFRERDDLSLTEMIKIKRNDDRHRLGLDSKSDDRPSMAQ